MGLFQSDPSNLGPSQGYRGGMFEAEFGLNPFLLTESQGWTDFIRFDVASDNIVGGITGDIYTVNGSPSYRQLPTSGNDALFGIAANETTEYFTNTGPDSSIRPGGGDFVVFLQLSHVGGGGAFQYIWDFDHNGTGTQEGIAVTIDGTNIDILVSDGTLNHITRWAHGGDVFEDGTLWTLRWAMDISETKGILTVKEEGETEVTATTTVSGSNLVDLGPIQPTGGARFFNRESSATFDPALTIFQWGIQSGLLTADASLKP